jgi:ATP-dependent exoDNAse (exonuclease V) beta subunit
MTVHAAKGLQFPVVAVPDLDRALAAGRRHADLVIGPPPDGADAEPGTHRFGMQLAFPAAKSFGLWELKDLNEAESVADAEEGCRLTYVAASRAEDRLILSGAFKPGYLEPVAEPGPGDSAIRRLLPALAELAGWDGGPGIVTVPGPVPAGGAERLARAAIEVRISEPSPERAAELVRRFEPPPEPEPLAGVVSPPPLIAERAARVPIGHLSYSALALYERCGYRFYVERVLGAREAIAPAVGPAEDDEAEGGRAADELAEPGVPRNLALGVGNAVHAALEWSARRAWEAPPQELLGRLLAREGLGDDHEAAGRADELVAGWLASDLRAELANATLHPELPFVLGLGPTVIRGQIDLLAEVDGNLPTVVDFKTDALAGHAPEELGSRYRAQREVYALAAGPDGARVAHVFLEDPSRPVIEEVAATELPAIRRRLEHVIERMRGGDFAVTEAPYAALCFGCPAAARLCPRPAWKPS